MNQGRAVFSQLLGFLPDREFRRCVARYGGDVSLRGFSCWDRYLSMAFAQLTCRDGLRDIEACLRSLGGKLYHMGFHGRVSRSTLADANDTHGWRIYADFAQVLIRIARPLYAFDPIGVDLDQSLYALDSATIDLCLSLFPRARFRKHKAVKMHPLLDLHSNILTFIRITDGKVHDVNVLDEILTEAGAFYVMDRGYVDFQRLCVFTLSAAFFVVRTKSNVCDAKSSAPAYPKGTGASPVLITVNRASPCEFVVVLFAEEVQGENDFKRSTVLKNCLKEVLLRPVHAADCQPLLRVGVWQENVMYMNQDAWFENW